MDTLYAEALALYQRRPAARATMEFEDERPIRLILRRVLETAVEAVTDPAGVRGCMVSCGMLFHAPENAAVAGHTAALRRLWQERLAARRQQTIDAGEIAPSPSADDLSRYVVSLMQGIAVQARGSAAREDLMTVVRIGLAGVLTQEPFEVAPRT